MDTSRHTVIVHGNRNFFLRSLKWFFVCLILGLAITLFVVIKTLLLTCVISILLAFLLEPVVRFFENYDIKRTWAIVIVFASIAIIIAFGTILFLPVVTTELQSLSANLQLKHLPFSLMSSRRRLKKNFPS